MAAKTFNTFADFERENLRPDMRIGWTVDEIEESGAELDFDMDPFEAALWEAENADDDE